MTFLSSEADAKRLPSPEKVTDQTQSRWPSSVTRHCPVAASQSLTVLSLEPDARRLSSPEKATGGCKMSFSNCSLMAFVAMVGSASIAPLMNYAV